MCGSFLFPRRQRSRGDDELAVVATRGPVTAGTRSYGRAAMRALGGGRIAGGHQRRHRRTFGFYAASWPRGVRAKSGHADETRARDCTELVGRLAGKGRVPSRRDGLGLLL